MWMGSYYSRREDDPRVYHIDDECPLGQHISVKYWASGKNDLPLCEICQQVRANRRENRGRSRRRTVRTN